MAKKTFVCLANSFKNGGRCVAGIEMHGSQFGSWIRPVSNRPGRSLSLAERSYVDGTECAVLDIVEADFDQAVPDGYQSENWLVSRHSRWKKTGQLSSQDLLHALHDGKGPLWPYTSSSQNGANDRISACHLHLIGNSLQLIGPTPCRFMVFPNPNKNNNLDVRAAFTWGGQANNLKVTDPDICQDLQARGPATYDLNGVFLCVSLGEIFAARNEAYKLVAAAFK